MTDTNRSQENSNYVEGYFTITGNLPFRVVFERGLDILAPLSALLIVLGVLANILNVVVFVKTSARDSVTVSFIALSTSDLCYLLLMSPHYAVRNASHVFQGRLGMSIKWLFDPRILVYPFYWYAFVFYETSTLITVYISVVRCACVAIPFKVKTTFTAGRAIAAFIIFFIFILVLRIPMLMTKSIIREFDPVTNTSRVVFKEVDDGGVASSINDIANRTILTWTSFITVVSCLVVMVIKLRASARFRSPGSSSKSAAPNRDAPDDAHDDSSTSEGTDQARSRTPQSQMAPSKVEKSEASSRKRQVLSSREAQVVRSVVLVAIVFITCQIPFTGYSLARRFESQFDIQVGESFSNSYLLLQNYK
ncbi:hypothetical protein RRG08_040647 [Elysia crispata]|uniref:G-protein coupled receptors family 1 profile domain-containing protein n=1 Tax=Elysia crispata TaxID=231223 RepID=A0AAE0YJ69_9GAST|nr:hypothetical protein RRG08_040647 [Elysia crispata]